MRCEWCPFVISTTQPIGSVNLFSSDPRQPCVGELAAKEDKLKVASYTARTSHVAKKTARQKKTARSKAQVSCRCIIRAVGYLSLRSAVDTHVQ